MSELHEQATGNASRSEPSRAPVVPEDEQLVHDGYVEFGGRDEIVVDVVEAIADVRDVPVVELVPNIQKAVDPDGLEHVFRQHPDASDREGWVTFFFRDCRVVLQSDGRLRIYDQRPA